MKQYKVTITVSRKDFPDLIDKLNKKEMHGLLIEPIGTEDPAPAKKANGGVPAINRNNLSQWEKSRLILMKGDRQGEPRGTTQQRMIEVHEELEAKHGIGSVTRRMLSAGLKAKNIVSASTITQLIRDGWFVEIQPQED